MNGVEDERMKEEVTTDGSRWNERQRGKDRGRSESKEGVERKDGGERLTPLSFSLGPY